MTRAPRGRTVAVVGAGAAGLTAALRAAEAGARVTLFNAHPKIGLKILMSGGTRCNVTHREVDASDFNGGSRPFVARILRAFPAEAARAWIESLGVTLKLEPTGKYFPETDDAQTVLDALMAAVQRAGVEVIAGARVIRLEPRSGVDVHGYRLGIQRVADSAAFGSGAVSPHAVASWPALEIEPDTRAEADAVIIATGGLSFPRTGSDGTGYRMLAALGHTFEPTVPALTPLTAADPLCRALQGVTLEAELTLRVDGKRAASTRGSFLIAHFGYSGPAALDLSRHWHRAEGSARAVSASFMPGETVETLLNGWVAAARTEPNITTRRWLSRRLPERLAAALCSEAGVEPSHAIAQVGRAARAKLIAAICERPLPVTGTLGYEKAEVTAGGVRLSEVDPSTLESRKAAGVFICGEALDVDGRLGGFNFQWSWSSGTVAGRAAAST